MPSQVKQTFLINIGKMMEYTKLKIHRAKSFRVTVAPELCKIILKYISDLTLLLIYTSSSSTPPTPSDLRAVLEPAYAALAPDLARLLHIQHIEPSELSGLSIDLHPTIGYFMIHVHRIFNHERHTYNIKIFGLDSRMERY